MDASRGARLTGAGMSAILARIAGLLTVNTGLAASGASLAASTALKADYNSSSSGTTGLKLPAWEIGSVVLFDNRSGGNNSIYPDSATVAIDSGTVGNAKTVANNSVYAFIKTSATNWNSFQVT